MILHEGVLFSDYVGFHLDFLDKVSPLEVVLGVLRGETGLTQSDGAVGFWGETDVVEGLLVQLAVGEGQ